MMDDLNDAALRMTPAMAADAAARSEASDSAVDEARLAAMADALESGDRDALTAAARGIPPGEVIDHYVPGLARSFGHGWSTDRMSFVDVTIFAARLQSWLRELESRSERPLDFRLDAPEVLLVVPAGSQHTLGALVVAAQFRRLGAAVRLSLGQDPDELSLMLRRQRFDLLAISAASDERVDFLRTLVNIARTGVPPAPKVIVGGPLLARDPGLGRRVGADAATSDPREALALCDRSVSARGSEPPSCATAERVRSEPRAAPGS